MNNPLSKTIHTLLPVMAAMLMTACGNGGDATTGSSGKIFNKDIRKKSCEILTAEMVAEIAGVAASDIEQKGSCRYSWEGGQATLVSLRTGKTPDIARHTFENSYRTKTREEVAEQLDGVADQVEKQSEEGKTDVDPGQARQVTDTMASAFGGGMTFEPVEGIGDAASFENTRNEVKVGSRSYISYANSLTVLTGNLLFTVNFSREGDPALFPDENQALARAVLGSLEDY